MSRCLRLDKVVASSMPITSYSKPLTRTDKVLELLRRWMPAQYDLAEVVGKWIWITFPEPPAEQVRGQLSQFGFHWNNARKCWQHPCGQFATEGSQQDPRAKYGAHFAADQVAA